MGKAIKVLLISGCIILLLGIGLVTAGTMMGGAIGVGPYLKQSGFGGTFWHGSYVRVDEMDVFSSDESFDGIAHLELKVGPGHTVELLEEPRENPNDTLVRVVRQDGSGVRYQVRIEGDQMEIRFPRLKAWERMEQLTIYVPEGFTFREADITVSAGEFSADMFRAESVSLEVNAGALTIYDGMINRLEADCRAGKLLCYAVADQDIEADCSAGNMEIMLAGIKQDYNYEIDLKTGNILFEDEDAEEYGGLSMKKSIDNRADANVELNCSAGSLTVMYSNSEL